MQRACNGTLVIYGLLSMSELTHASPQFILFDVKHSTFEVCLRRFSGPKLKRSGVNDQGLSCEQCFEHMLQEASPVELLNVNFEAQR